MSKARLPLIRRDSLLYSMLAKLTPSEVKVYTVLLGHVNEDRECWPGNDLIEQTAGLGRKTVINAIKGLEGKGLVDKRRRRRDSSVYTLNLEVAQDGTSKRLRSVVSRPLEVSIEDVKKSPLADFSLYTEHTQEHTHEASEFSFPLRGRGGDWELPADRLDEYRKAYPGQDIEAELRRARLWLIDNPDRRKTAKGMPRFLSGWLGRAKPTEAKARTTSDELDAICPLVEPTDDDFAAVFGEVSR